MKQIVGFVSIVILMVLAFFLGRVTSSPSNNQESDEMTIQKNGVLAYQHYYEVAEDMLATESPDSILLADYNSAKIHLDDYKSRHTMMWPEVCNQRDMLSDAIRCFYDHHPKLADNREDDIMEYVRDFGINPEILWKWSFSYLLLEYHENSNIFALDYDSLIHSWEYHRTGAISHLKKDISLLSSR